MEKLKEIKAKLLAAWAKTEPFRTRVSTVFGKIGYVLSVIGKWIYNLRSILLSIPVVILAVKIAMEGMKRLPETVGIWLLSNGEYQWEVARNLAVMGPLAVTAACLLMMFCSRRVVYPWLISLFSLVLPILIYITNVFPA